MFPKMLHVFRHVFLTMSLIFLPSSAFAAGLDGASLGWMWTLPFIGMLLSIALMPLFAQHFWEHHQGKVSAFWACLTIIPLLLFFESTVSLPILVHAILLEYIPFIVLLLALFTVAGGIVIRGNIHGSPVTNTILLAIGTFLASFIGTTGAAMVLIRPVLRANDNRYHQVHIIVFFIFLVANIGGSLSPLGDPPLFLGFLKGVNFFWTTQHLILETLLASGILLALFFLIDSYYFRKETILKPDPTPDSAVRVVGGLNFLMIGVIISLILISASIDIGHMTILGMDIPFINMVRDIGMVCVAGVSLLTTPQTSRIENDFSWGPILEVAKLFAAIFITIVPVIAILQAGHAGKLSSLVALVTTDSGEANNVAYFWLTGALSSVLDNAPTYLVFFELAGGDPQYLMTVGAKTLAAISLGAVYMGANTYLGNAPNFMVYAIARQNGVKMPSFFGYMLWSGAILLPTFALISYLFLR